MKSIKSLIRQSHEQQFYGEDYQAAAIGLADANGISYESDEYTMLQSAPDPNCDCGFCKRLLGLINS